MEVLTNMGHMLHDLAGLRVGNLQPIDPKSPTIAPGWHWLRALEHFPAEPMVHVPIRCTLSIAQMSIPIPKVRAAF